MRLIDTQMLMKIERLQLERRKVIDYVVENIGRPSDLQRYRRKSEIEVPPPGL